MKLKNYILMILFLAGFTTSAQSWQELGAGAFLQYSSFALSIHDGGTLTVDNNGIPHAVFIDPQSEYNKVGIVKKFVNNNWEYVGGMNFSTDLSLTMYVYLSSSLVFDSNNVPYIAYLNGNGTVIVKTIVNGVWQNVGTTEISSENSRHCAMVLNDNNVPYVVYSDGSNSGKATVKKFENGSWQLVGLPGFSIGLIYGTSIVIDTDNNVFIMYTDSQIGTDVKTVRINKFENGIWSAVGNNEDVEGNYASIENKLFVGTNNVLYLVYGIRMFDNPDLYKVVFKKYINNQWQIVSELLFEETINLQMNKSFDLINDIPYVAFSDEINMNKAKVVKFENGMWQTVGTTGFSIADVFNVKLAVDANGTCYVSYKDSANPGYSLTVMKYDTTLGIDKNNMNNKIILYPNPANELITITTVSDGTIIKIFDIAGKQVYTSQINNPAAIDVSALANGVYLVQILTNSGLRTVEKLFISR